MRRLQSKCSMQVFWTSGEPFRFAMRQCDDNVGKNKLGLG